jgi:hypothetical protein
MHTKEVAFCCRCRYYGFEYLFGSDVLHVRQALDRTRMIHFRWPALLRCLTAGAIRRLAEGADHASNGDKEADAGRHRCRRWSGQSSSV